MREKDPHHRVSMGNMNKMDGLCPGKAFLPEDFATLHKMPKLCSHPLTRTQGLQVATDVIQSLPGH